MPAKVYSAAIVGLDGEKVDVQADVSSGLHSFGIVGLPDAAVKESRDRVSSAIKNSGFRPPNRCGRVTVNLAPADLPKSGPIYDLPIALALLAATDQLRVDWEEKMFIGELALDGTVRPVVGTLVLTLLARKLGVREVFVPEQNAAEARVVSGVRVYPLSSLRQAVEHLGGDSPLEPLPQIAFEDIEDVSAEVAAVDMKDVRGQEHAKRALEIAAAGGHNVLLSGTPGSGKTLMARAMPGILPKLTFAESLEITKIYSIAGQLPPEVSLLKRRPFRSPHHSSSAVSLIGGGTVPKPGEISLAHHGVLFLDEFAEFPKSVLENLRQPLEDGFVSVSRARGSALFPADFVLVAAMNPCQCGYAGDPYHPCACPPSQLARYRRKISGPIMDRIDLHVSVGRVKIDKLQSDRDGEPSAAIRERVEAARRAQRRRFGDRRTNAGMNVADIKKFCRLDREGAALLRKAIVGMKLSARSYHRLIKIARTIADLAGSEEIKSAHIAEAVGYRFETD
ncbi:MAG TPA: ATP-binding protein [Candidatus Moranbacteria bacterium]|nr:ATP-binding protein [Candidatus Moranbacteria bacterium]